MNIFLNQSANDNRKKKDISLFKSIISALRWKCPKCHKGKLFNTYLKQTTSCPSCQLDLSAFRSDDGPAWLTIFIVGHLLIPLIFYLSMNDAISEWLSIVCLCVVAGIAGLAVLPFSKAFFVAVLWYLHEKNHRDAI